MKLVLLAVLFLAVAVAGIAIKLLIKKDGEFKKSCSSIDPKTGKAFGCSCGNEGKNTANCENFKQHHPGK